MLHSEVVPVDTFVLFLLLVCAQTCTVLQSNNCYIFPGIGLGCAISGAIRVHDDMFLAAGMFLRFHPCSFMFPITRISIFHLPSTWVLSFPSCHLLLGVFWCVFIAEALAKQINEEHLAKNQLYPAFNEIREISAHIGAAVAAKAYELGMLSLPVSMTAFCMLSGNMSFDRVLGVECRIGNKTAAAQRSLYLCQKLHVQPKLSQVSVGVFLDRELCGSSLLVGCECETENLLSIHCVSICPLLNKNETCADYF